MSCELNKKPKTKQLYELLQSSDIEFLMECHNGMSAKVAQEAGFKGLWLSGLSLSASLGVRDNNELSFTQVTDICRYIDDCTDIPLLVDMDTGYGDFNTARRVAVQMLKAGVAGVCIEDKKFPKTNSFLNKSTDELADPDEHALKIKAVVDETHKYDEHFVVVARLEGLIAGIGYEKTFERAEKYCEAGATALLVHSKKSTFDELRGFLHYFREKSKYPNIPIVIVPTKYYRTPTDEFRKEGVAIAIWANHNMRTCITEMRKCCKSIYETESLVEVESKVISVSDVFKFQNNEELEKAEEKYLPGSKYEAFILGATRGSSPSLEELTKDKPKMMIPLGSKPLVQYQIDNFKAVGVSNIKLAVGYKSEYVEDYVLHNVKGGSTYYSKDYDVGYEVSSLIPLHKKSFISYGDLVYKRTLLHDMLDNTDDCDLVVAITDKMRDGYTEYITKNGGFVRSSSDIGHEVMVKDAVGYLIGVMMVNNVELYNEALNHFNEVITPRMKDLINVMISKGARITYVTIPHQSWIDVNDITNYTDASRLLI